MRWLLAFIITMVVYILLIWLYIIGFSDMKLIEKPKQKDNRIRISLKEYIPPKKAVIDKPISKPNIIKHKIEHKKPLKKNTKHIKFKVKKIQKKKSIKKVSKHKKVVSKKKNSIKKIDKNPNKDMVYISTPLFKNNRVSSTPKYIQKKKAYPNNKIKRLYGKEFLSYTQKQKKFIEQNLDEIHRITQNVLWQRGYPGGYMAAKTNQQGTNIVSFYLHPNGDISDLKLKKRIGYRLLDENSLETIKSAYKDYPYPSETTKIVFFVEYSIFGY